MVSMPIRIRSFILGADLHPYPDHTQVLHILENKHIFDYYSQQYQPTMFYLFRQHHRFHNFSIFWTVYWNFLEKIEFRVTFGLNWRGSESARPAGCGSGKKNYVIRPEPQHLQIGNWKHWNSRRKYMQIWDSMVLCTLCTLYYVMYPMSWSIYSKSYPTCDGCPTPLFCSDSGVTKICAVYITRAGRYLLLPVLIKYQELYR